MLSNGEENKDEPERTGENIPRGGDRQKEKFPRILERTCIVTMFNLMNDWTFHTKQDIQNRELRENFCARSSPHLSSLRWGEGLGGGGRARPDASGTLADPGIRDCPGPVNDYQIFNPFLWLGGG
jgi:hypothetical protein